MSEQKQDAEIEAMGAVWSALEVLSPEAQQRVIAYVMQRLNLDVTPPTTERVFTGLDTISSEAAPPITTAGTPPTADIRSFAELKAPKTAIEMAAVTAYFLEHEAPPSERKTTITAEDIKKYFHLARFPAPKDIGSTLPNAKKAGYVDLKGNGQYALNAVGYNLVMHRLQSGGSAKSRGAKVKSSKKG